MIADPHHAPEGPCTVLLRPSHENGECRIRVDSGPPLNTNIRISCMSAFGCALDVHTPLAFVALQASDVAVDGMEAGNHHSKVSSSCEIILKLKPKCRYSRRVPSGAGTEGRRKPESETSEGVSLCATGRHPDRGRRGRAERVSDVQCRGRFSPRPNGPEN
jgi:hypothetical protein